MKWLKKNSSDNEQISIAESQPGPEQNSEIAPDEIYAPSPETLEQSETAIAMTEARQPTRTSGRRRSQREPQEGMADSKRASNPFAFLKNSWIGHHWKTFVILFAIFCIAFFARAYYGLGPATEDGILLSGGSDSYYHHYVVTVGSETGDFHFWDDMLNYPLGTRNPRPPLYDWSITLSGMALAPFFDGDVHTSTLYFFIFSTAFWGALTIYPTYFLGKEAFGRKTGIFAAFLLALLPGHVQRSVLTNADHDAMTLFFIVLAFFFFLKALKTMAQKDYVSNWAKPREVFAGMKDFLASNQQSLLYGVLGGFSLAGVALIWQGFAYAMVLISVYFFVQILINRFRNIDSFGVFVIYFVTVGVGLILAFPYYYQSIQIASWFDTPAYLFLGLSVFAVILMATRKYPWFLVFTSIIAVSLLSVILLKLLAPEILDSLVNALLSGGGYFINNKQYQTIAEAQAPPFSNLALSFGIITFWLSFIGVAWAAIQLPKSWKPDFTFILLWAGTSIYMAVSAARFMFNAAPAFAIAAGWVLAIILGKLNLKKLVEELKRAAKPHMTYRFKMGMVGAVALLLVIFVVLTTISSIAFPIFVMGITIICCIYMLNLIAETNPSRIYNLLTVLVPISGAIFYIASEFYTDWVLTDATHLFVLGVMFFGYMALYFQVRRTSFMFTAGIVFLIFCIVVPNAWAGLDAGIPYEVKSDYDRDIYNAMPVFMQPSDYDVKNGTNWYLGGFGYSLPLNNRYWPAAYNWLSEQDTDIYPPQARPAFLSWWDYGFEVINQGAHPTVADNFLGGHQLAGNFIMAQSEKDAIALLCVRILEGDWYNDALRGQAQSFNPELANVLQGHGIDMAMLNDIFDNPSRYAAIILANPDIYGPRDDLIQDANARYIATRVLLTQALDMHGMVNLYNDISSVTGQSIQYFGIDSRLFPFSSQNTGIFYAPAKLSDHRISDVANQPYDFWEIKAVGEYGGEYDLDDIPLDVNLDPNEPYRLVYKDMFYNSMLYRAFVGYSGQDINQGDTGMPGLSGDLASNPIMPGWNMSHFKLVHRTAYWNPYSADVIQDHTDAWKAMNYWDAYEKQEEGIGVSDLSDRSSLYQGVMMLKYYHGAIISGKVVLQDGTPLAGVSVTVYDDFNIPHQRVITDSDGQYSIIAPPGDISIVASTGEIDPLYLMGTEVNYTTMFIDDHQAMRANEDRNRDGIPDYLISQDLVVQNSALSGAVFWDIDSDSIFDDEVDEILKGVQITITNSELSFEAINYSDNSGNYDFPILPPGVYDVLFSYANRDIGTHQINLGIGESLEYDFPMTVTTLEGTVLFGDGNPAYSVRVRAWNSEDGIEFDTVADNNGYYKFDNILHGNLSVQAERGGYASIPQRIEFSQFMNNSLDMTIYQSSSLSGQVTINGIPVPYATIKFSGPSSVVLSTDASGIFSATLIDGEYIYYISHSKGNMLYSSIGQVYMDDDGILDIPLQPGSVVTGTINTPFDYGAPETLIVFENQDTGFYISASTGSTGDYSIVLPQGKYRVQVSSSYFGCYYGMHYISQRSIHLNINTRFGEIVSGGIYWDVGSDDLVSDEEGLAEARITFTDSTGNYAQAITDETGSFAIILPPATPFHVTISRKGFHSVDLGTHTTATLSNGIMQSLEPILIPVIGSLYLGEEPLTDQNIILHFNSQLAGHSSMEFQVARDGKYAGSLSPGLYSITFTHNVTIGDDNEVYQIERDILFDSGFYDGRTVVMDIAAAQRTKVSISISNPDIVGANITLKNGPESRTIDMRTNHNTYYLMQGDYVLSAVHALNDTIMVDMQDISVIDGLNNFTVTLKNGYLYTGSLMYGSQYIADKSITFRDTGSNGTISVYTDESGLFEVYLVPGLKYMIEVDYVSYDTEPYLRAYRYYSTDRIFDTEVPDSSNMIVLEREIHRIHLSGSITWDDSAASNAVLQFSSHYDNYTVTTDVDGGFALDIVPGEYTVYAHHPSSHYVSLSQTIIEIGQVGLNIALDKGYRLYGTAYYDRNMNAITDITFTSSNGTSHTIYTDASGYYEIWLPKNTYSILGEFTAIRNDMEVVYSLDIPLQHDRDRQLNLPLTMIENRIVFVSFDPSQLKKVRSNSTVTYTFEVENMGNIRDTYDIIVNGGSPEWVTDASVREISIDPGEKSRATLAVTVFVPPTARLNQNGVTITAISQKDTTIRHSNTMNLFIEQRHAFSIQPSATAPEFNMGDLKSEFTVLNSGNGADILTLYIANNEELLLNGWKAELGAAGVSDIVNDGRRLVNVSISSDDSVNIPIYLYPANDNPSRRANVLIVGFSQIDNSVIISNNIILRYPELQLSTTNLTVSGSGVSEARSGDQAANVGVMAISVASALLIFYYARKKRWIK